jgi:hypothetical protein
MKGTENCYRLAYLRTDEAFKLRKLAGSLIAPGDDPLDDLGMLRLVERQVEQVRKTFVAEAQVAGFTWRQIGDTLGMSAEDARRRYYRPKPRF